MKDYFPNFKIVLVAFMLGFITIFGCASTEKASEISETDVLAGESARLYTILVCPIDTVTVGRESSRMRYVLAPLIRRDLFCVQRLSVVPAESTRVPMKASFLNQSGLAKLARAHGADVVTTGIVSGDEEEITIKFTAFDLKARKYILRAEIEGEVSKIFELEKSIIDQLLSAMEITLTRQERKRMTSCTPKNFEAARQYALGAEKEQEEKYTDALLAYEKAATLDRCFALPYVGSARLSNRYQAPRRAAEALESAVERDKNFATAWYQLSHQVARYQKDNERAAEYCRKALEIAPRFGKARLSLGARLHDLGDLPQAIEETKLAVQLLPHDAKAAYNLGALYRDAGMPGEARMWFNRTLEIDPNFKYAKEELRKLDGK